MSELFDIYVPDCSDTKWSISVHAGTVGIHCSGGVILTVNVELRKIGDW